MNLIKIKKGKVELEVVERVYNIVYAHHGFEVVTETKKPTRKKRGQNDT